MTTLEFNSKVAGGIQSIDVPKGVTTLIGGNGSGKSSILEAIFKKYIEDENLRVIAFSSGQNELFTNLFNKHKATNKRYLKENNAKIQSFYFNSNWLRLLIFWATIFKPQGYVRKYLKNEGYIETNDFNDDISSRLYFKFRIKKAYIKNIRKEIEDEELGKSEDQGYSFQDNLLRKTYFHETLEKIVEVFEIDFDFQNNDNLVKRKLVFDSDKVFKVFTHKDIDKTFSFWALATNGWLSNCNLQDISLKFKNGLDFYNLSDGEYQLLSIYALLDLFDSSDTIFLFDEADSHLYYENLLLMWNILHEAEGTILTTTHISESILQNNFENLKLVENGEVKSNIPFKELSKRLDNVVGEKNYQFKILSRVEYPVLMDNINDWTIFRKLVIKKIGVDAKPVLDKFLPISKSSSFNRTGEKFGRAKLEFIKEFKRENEETKIITKNIFLICDKDNLPDSEISTDSTVNIDRDFKEIKKFNSNQTKTHLLSWKRREIENYLLSPTLFDLKKCKSEIDSLYTFPSYEIGDNLDSITDFRIGDFKTVLRPLYNDDSGFNEVMLEDLINLIPKEEISEDIVSVYNYLKITINNE